MQIRSHVVLVPQVRLTLEALTATTVQWAPSVQVKSAFAASDAEISQRVPVPVQVPEQFCPTSHDKPVQSHPPPHTHASPPAPHFLSHAHPLEQARRASAPLRLDPESTAPGVMTLGTTSEPL